MKNQIQPARGDRKIVRRVWRCATRRWNVATMLALSLVVVGLVEEPRKAVAQERDKTTSDWSFSIAPYLWLAGLEGRLATLPGLPPADIQLDFDEILEDLDFGFFVAGDARKDRFVVVYDLNYVRTTSSNNLRGLFFSSAKLESEIFVASVGAGYRVVNKDDRSLDLFGGVRAWVVDTDLTLGAGALRPTSRISHNESWVDPIVGFRGAASISPNWAVALSGTIGGFGIAADLDWGVFGGVTYQIRDSVNLAVGYRHLSVDYQNDGFLFDVEQTGPILGLSFSF